MINITPIDAITIDESKHPIGNIITPKQKSIKLILLIKLNY